MTDGYVPGLTQSQMLTLAAQDLTLARYRAKQAGDMATLFPTFAYTQDASNSHAVLRAAQAAYTSAFEAYTNPFGTRSYA